MLDLKIYLIQLNTIIQNFDRIRPLLTDAENDRFEEALRHLFTQINTATDEDLIKLVDDLTDFGLKSLAGVIFREIGHAAREDSQEKVRSPSNDYHLTPEQLNELKNELQESLRRLLTYTIDQSETTRREVTSADDTLLDIPDTDSPSYYGDNEFSIDGVSPTSVHREPTTELYQDIDQLGEVEPENLPADDLPPRIPTFRLYHCGNDHECDSPELWASRPLQARHWYQLEVRIESSLTVQNVQPHTPSDAQPIPSEIKADDDLVVSISAEYNLFEFAEQTALLRLSSEGVSIEGVRFRLSPLAPSAMPIPIIVRLYYRTNLLQRLAIKVRIVDTYEPAPVDPDAQRYQLEELRSLEHLAILKRVKIHIDVDRSLQQDGTYLLTIKADSVQLFGTGAFNNGHFEDWINQAREALSDISFGYHALHEAQMANQEVIAQQQYLVQLRKLAIAGKRIFNELFRGSNDLRAIAAWWRANQPAKGSLIQIDLRGAPDFVVPWGIVFDSPLYPTNDQDLTQITLDDFWGFRYQIEQNVGDGRLDEPPVYPVEAAVPFAMMIGAEPLGTRHLNSIKALAEKTLAPQIVVSPPITKPTQAFSLFNMDSQSAQARSPLVYFIGHAYVRKESRLDIRNGLEMFCKQQKERPDDRYADSFNIFCTDEFGGKTSFFELSFGRVQIEDELGDERICLARTRPLFFFNACQSAQYPPSPSSGLVYRLLNNKAGGFIGTEVFIDAEFAETFGESFWTEFLRGATVGEAMLNVRRAFAEKQVLLGLAYVHYGSCGVRLERSLLLGEESARPVDTLQ